MILNLWGMKDNSQVAITNLLNSKSVNPFLRKAAEYCLKRLGIKKDISVVLVGDKKIKSLNSLYRRKNRVTDVLAFGDFFAPGGEKDFLGEIAICLPQARRQAKAYGVSLKQELVRLLLHGILHLAGFEHERGGKEAKRMFDLQERILKHVTYNM